MNHQHSIFNPNMPMINHTDWASMAKQWATLRANVNIPPAVTKSENYNYHHIPPPPPPPPSNPIISPNHMSYNNDYHPVVNHEPMISFNRNQSNYQGNNNSSYEAPMHSVYNEISSNLPPNHPSNCETYDYNHRDRAFINYNNMNPYRPPPNIFNMPPPTHQDYIENPVPKPAFMPEIQPPKLFPIGNSEDYLPMKSQPTHNFVTTNVKPTPPFMINKYENHLQAPPNRSNKGLPAWIIDDMKKIKEKEQKPSYASIDDYKDHHVNSRRDEEGDIVMEDDLGRDSTEIDNVLSGKSVIAPNRIDCSATEIDIDDVNLIDEDDTFDKIDYSSKSLLDLIEMLDENELENLKISIIRDSLTAVMKQVTDNMISEVVNLSFTDELCKLHPRSSGKGISDATVKSIDAPTVDYQLDAASHLLGLDVYESDDEELETEKATDAPTPVVSESRKKWSSHKKTSESSKIESKTSSQDKDDKSQSKDKKKSSNDNKNKSATPKHKIRSESRDHNRKRSKSRDYHRRSRSKDRSGRSSEHKKSKKHNKSPDPRDKKWKNDKCDRNNGVKKHSKRDRSRS